MAEEQAKFRGWKLWTMVAVVLGSGIVFLDTSVVNLALPKIADELPRGAFAKLEVQGYVQNGYFVTLSALLILAGALTDYHGRRKVFAIGLAGFGLTSLLCGLAPNAQLLIVFRILQGAAGAFVVPGSLSIIASSFDGEEQGRAFGLWAAASAATTIIGPFIGGLLVDTISWRAAFLINVPLILIALYATLRHVPESRDEEATGRFDVMGSLIIIVAIAGLSFGPVRGEQSQWRELLVPLVSIGVGLAAAIAFPFVMKRSRDPLVPLGLFRSRNFSVTNISTFVIYGALYVVLGFMGIFLIGTLGYTARAAGLAMVPATLLLVLFSSRFGKLSARFGPRFFMSAGPAIMGVGLLWFLRFPDGSAPWALGTGPGETLLPPADYWVHIFPGILVFGAGLMMMVAPLTTALMTSLPKRTSGLASAINNAISRVGSPIVFALIFVVIAAGFYGSIQDRVPEAPVNESSFRRDVSPLNAPPDDASADLAAATREASTDAFRLAMLVASLMLFAGAAVNAAGISNRQAIEYPHAEPGERLPEEEEAEPATPPDHELAPAPACVICGEEGTAASHGHAVDAPDT
ncbi:MAG TPA: MFS transporter [Actinomycetota bacterium]